MASRNRKLIFALLITVLFMCFSAAALASVSASVSPESFSAAGEAAITLVLKNDGTGAMENIAIESSSSAVSFSADGIVIAEGGEHAFEKTVSVTEEMLGEKISFDVSWTQNGEEKSSSASVTLKRASSGKVLTARRSVSSRQASPGETITLKYTLKNNGTENMTHVSITDKDIGGNSPIVSGIIIAPGETYEYSYQFKMGYETVISQPVIKYTIGEQSKTYEGVEQMTLGMVNTKLTVEVEQGLGTEEGVVFTLYLTNNGNQKIKDIKIVDELGKSVSSESFTLAVGETKSLTHKVDNDEERYVVFTITGVDASGEAYTDKTESHVIRPYIDPTSLGMEFGVAVLETLNKDGNVTIRFTVNNTGTVPYKSIKITEAELGEICEVENITPGTHKMEESIYVGLPRDLVFSLVVTDPVGNPYTYTANLSADYIGVANMATKAPEGNSLDRMGLAIDNAVSDTLVVILIVLGVLSALAIAALAALTSLEKKMKAQAAAKKRQRMQNGNSK